VLTALPESLGQLAALTTLNLSGCRALTGLPAWMEQRTTWVSLGLPPCIRVLPDWVTQLAALTTLDLSECRRVDGAARVAGPAGGADDAGSQLVSRVDGAARVAGPAGGADDAESQRV
jgi:Leucine-rich repeat (LRR) protein